MPGPNHQTTVENPIPPQDLAGFLGHRFVYTYANGWQYEMYIKNAATIDYRIHSGHVGGRWVKHQQADIVMLTKGVFKVSWNEPTGTSVAVNFIPSERVVHGVIFFPQWVRRHGERTVLFQNDHIDQMLAYRDEGPTYPIHIVSEFGRITRIDNIGENNEEAISCAPSALPDGWSGRVD
ncbi:MAG: phenolic acid decarboxylase [Acidobacteriota bacterium]